MARPGEDIEGKFHGFDDGEWYRVVQRTWSEKAGK